LNHELKLDLRGMTCAACVARVDKSLRKLPGIRDVSVNLVAEQATLTYDSTSLPEIEQAVAAVEKAGYKAFAVRTDQNLSEVLALRAHSKEDELQEQRRNLLWAIALSLPVVALEMGGHLGPAWHHLVERMLGSSLNNAIQAVLTTAVMLGPGRQFFIAGVPGLLRGAPNMNSLVALGAGLAWALSLVLISFKALNPIANGAVFFEAATVMVTLILVGRYLEARARLQTGDAISQLLALQPTQATVQTAQGPQLRDLASIHPDDVLIVRPGDAVALDSLIIEGQCEVDESMLTGESQPVLKRPGDTIFGGTQSKLGAVQARVLASASEGRLSQIVGMVHQAQASRLPIQDVIDRIAMWFVPVVLGIALLTGLVWWWLGASWLVALITAITVVIVACPCAMGLATPISIVVAVGRAARLGILLRQGRVLQVLSGVKVIAFDKTGTLTQGRLRLGSWIHLSAAHDEAQVLQWAASAEQQSEHPAARALMDAAKARGLPLQRATDFEALPGRGVCATVDGNSVRVGALSWMKELGLTVPESAGSLPRSQAGLAVASNNEVLAVFEMSDQVRSSSKLALSALRERKIAVAIVSGDQASKVDALADELGVELRYSECLPERKVELVAELRQRYGPVAFVGDGINDAPVLAKADVGVAMGAGSPIAMTSADIVLARDDLGAIDQAFDLAHYTMRNIEQNLFWAFAYNAALIPLAAGVFRPWLGWSFSPMAAAGAMALSSVFVVVNALRLRKA
jgi:heavy metal translocating P-type ATPase